MISLRRRSMQNQQPQYEVVRFSSSGSWTVPAEVKKIDLFLVGGGGAGNRWVTWGYSYGGSGGGGDTNTVKKISVIPGQQIQLNIGAGGIANGANGGDTIVLIGEETYTAIGGKGGIQGQYNLPDYDYIHQILGKSGFNGGLYENSGHCLVFPVSSSTIGVIKNANNEVVVSDIDISIYNTNSVSTGINPFEYKWGVPEFWEEGNPLHAAGGHSDQCCKAITDFNLGKGNDRSRYYNANDNGVIYGGGGFGGGGAGGYYGGTAGANGGAGGVVIRYRIK